MHEKAEKPAFLVFIFGICMHFWYLVIFGIFFYIFGIKITFLVIFILFLFYENIFGILLPDHLDFGIFGILSVLVVCSPNLYLSNH